MKGVRVCQSNTDRVNLHFSAGYGVGQGLGEVPVGHAATSERKQWKWFTELGWDTLIELLMAS